MVDSSIDSWEVVIGLEVHAQVQSRAKLFSGAATDFGAEPNCQVSLIDAGAPGMLPVINRHCVEQAIRTGIGLSAEINLFSVFDRKNYFYPDLPQGYQISQYTKPIVGYGSVQILLDDGEIRTVGITRLHLEQDAGKSLHDQHPTQSFVDLNRSGIALMEIVSEPDMRSSQEAGAYIRKIRSILRYLGTCDGNMQEGSLRADVNVSVRRPGGDYGVRCEIKNVNSIRFIQQAIDYEARRQIQLIESGNAVQQQTRLFDSATGSTREMRTKEEAHDYRYFPDPDLLPLELDPDWVEEIRLSLPELPDEKKERFVREFGLSDYDAGILVAERDTAEFYEMVASGRDPKLAANWVIGELFGNLNRNNVEISSSPVSANSLGKLIDLVVDNTISGRSAKEVFEVMFSSGRDPLEIVSELGLQQLTDLSDIESLVSDVLANQADKVLEYRAGKDKLFGFFVGQVMKASAGKANPKIVNEVLGRLLKG